MAADGRVLDPELRRDRAVVQADCHQVEHLAFSRRQPLDPVGDGRPADTPNACRARMLRRDTSADNTVGHHRAGTVAVKRRYRREN